MHMTLEQMLLRELSRMLQRRLRYSPTAEDIPATVAVMADDFRRRGFTDDDGERIADALNDVGCRLKEWPNVAMVIEYLKPQPPMTRLGHDDRHQRRASYANGLNRLRRTLGMEEVERPKG